MELRRLDMTESDLAADQFRVAAALIPGFDPTRRTSEETRASYHAAMLRGPVWGVFADDVLLGHIALEPGWIEHLYVDPARHGEGIGRKLLEQAMRDQDDLQLYTYVANRRARRMYEAAGFLAEEFGVDPDHPMKAPNVRYRWRRAATA